MRNADQFGEQADSPKMEMHELAEVFIYCFTMELNRVSQVGEDVATAVIQRWDLLLRRKPYFMFGPTQLNEMAAMMFGDHPSASADLTDFVLSVTISLQTHLVRNGQNITDLCRDLADALILFEAGTPDKHNATANVFTERLTEKDTIMCTLRANRWLLTILLGVLFTPELLAATREAERTSSGKRKPQVVQS
jgi:hypothetical protein